MSNVLFCIAAILFSIASILYISSWVDGNIFKKDESCYVGAIFVEGPYGLAIVGDTMFCGEFQDMIGPSERFRERVRDF